MAGKVVYINSETVGKGDERLGGILMANFLRTLGDSAEKPVAIFLINGGVKLAAEGSPVLDHLAHLEETGVEVLSCRTCVEWFDLEQKIEVGRISSMAAFVQLAMGNQVISP